MRKISRLWDVFKLEALIVYSYAYSWAAWRRQLHCKILSWEAISYFWTKYREARHYIASYRREFIYTKQLVLSGCSYRGIGNIFNALIATAWLCEKMQVNLKVEGLSDFFENDVIINNSLKYHESHFEDTKEFFAGKANILWVGAMYIHSEYGFKISQKMQVKKELMECADEWFNNHIKGHWAAVHYRGTDVKVKFKYRYVDIEDYIAYLGKVLGDKCNILACSDQVQFVDRMHIAFPGRVFVRDIQRSCDYRMLHTDPEYIGIQQKKDAFIDLLILAKADFVYATGSGFVDTLRFLNPSIKIASLDGRWLVKSFPLGRNSPNGMPIPEKEWFKKINKNRENLLN